MSESSRLPRAVWMLSLAASIAFLVADSVVRVRGIHVLTEASVGARAIAPDPATPSGYEGNQHDLVLPIVGTDGYQWAMQTQQILAGGASRVRWVDYDGPPQGRSVHWSSLLHWWTAVFAWIVGKARGISAALAVERVIPWVNTAFLGLLLLALVPVVARRFGALPAALLAVGAVAGYPVYDLYVVGNYDHHGVASSAALLTVLFLLGGGAGWVRTDAAASRLKPGERPPWEWLLDEPYARRWFIASGIAGGAGLWISAATQIPALFGIGIGVLAAGVLARGGERSTAWRAAPQLWRTWGMAGAASSLFFYLLEYFPSHMGVRLEVNHPLYALAWLGAGDLMFRLCAMMNRGEAEPHTSGAAWMALDVALFGLAPAIMWLVPHTFVLRPGSLVMALHEDYIAEFHSLARQISTWTWAQLNAGVGLLPLLIIAPAAALGAVTRIAKPLRALAILSLVPAITYTVLALMQVRWMGIAFALWLATLVAVATIATLGWRDAWQWPAVQRVLLGVVISLPAAIVPVVVIHAKEAAIAAGVESPAWTSALAPLAVLLVIMAVLATVLPTLALVGRWTSARLVCGGAMLGLAFAPFPVLSVYKWTTSDWVYPIAPDEYTQVVTRDVSHRLRARLGAERGVIASGPTTTTWMMYFGGFKGIGTLYWENREGLEDGAKLFGATARASGGSSADSALTLIKHLGVTHIVLFSWNTFTAEYARLALGIRAPAVPTSVDDDVTKGAFGPQLLQGSVPTWLRPMPYRVPAMSGFENPWVVVFEVVPGQTPKEAATHFAQYCVAMNDEDAAMRQLDAALAIDPGYVPALVNLARVQFGNAKRGDYRATVQRIQRARGADSLALEDNIGLASLYMQMGDTAHSREIVQRALAQADEHSVRRLPWDYTTANFLILARQFGLAGRRPEIMNFALGMLDPAVQAQLTAPPGGRR